MTQSTHAQSLNGSLASNTPRIAHTDATRARIWNSIMSVSRRAQQCLRQWQRNRAAYRHLAKLPDELLNDVGLNRNEVHRQMNRSLISYWRGNRA